MSKVSSEMRKNDTFWIKIPNLPTPTYGACLTQLNEQEVILLGGVQNYSVSRMPSKIYLTSVLLNIPKSYLTYLITVLNTAFK